MRAQVKKERGQDALVKADYEVVVEGSNVIRFVKPYVQAFKTFAKGRWVGRELIEVLTREFGGHPAEYWINAVSRGHVRINGEIVPPTYRFKNSDLFLHRTHRHEPPVFGEVALIGNTENYMAVCKPQSLPMHPCGGYRHNSLEYILRNEPLISEQPKLHLVHRLDRVTSGLVVLAKSKEAAAVISKDIRDKSTKKVYLARVKGRFPAQLSHIRQLEAIDFDSVAGLDDDEAGDEGQEGAGDKRKKVDLPKPNDNAESAGAVPSDSTAARKERLTYKEMKRAKFEQKQAGPVVNHGQSGKDVDEADLPPRVLPTKSKEEVGAAEGVGYKYESVDWPSSSGTSPVTQQQQQVLWLQCPIIVLSHRDGIHGCDPAGKPSISSFRLLGYCAETDTSLVECGPYTGRTHQLRLHLQFLGCPIANDPCYGGQLFYGDEPRRRRALDQLRAMRASGSHPLSKVPHFNDPELDGLVDDSTVVRDCAEHAHRSSEEDMEQREGETDDEYLLRTCRYCKNGSGDSSNLEYLLHCDGIWLHALRYTGKDWSFETPYPDWARGFAL